MFYCSITVPLGRIGQRGSGCKLEAEYSLDPGETVVKLRKDVLWVRTSDLADDFNVTVKCSIGGVSFVRTFTVDVLPRTPWQISSKEAVRLIPSNDVEKGDSFIVSWGFFKEGSRADLVQTTKTSLYSLRMDKHFISSYVANKTLFIITLEWSLCCPNMSLPMVVDANLQVSEPGFPKQEVLLRTVLQTSNFRASLPKLTYPPRMEIYPGLSSLARLAYPNRTRDFATILSNVTFTSVLPSDLTSPFAVTSKAGIVYLDVHRDQQYLYYNFTGELIEWRVNDSTLLQVSWLPAVWNLTSPKGPSCSASQPGDDTFSNDFRYELQCSVKETKKECQSTCGLGASTSKEGFCTWITPSKPLKYSNSTKKPFKISYTTCSTDKFFCPDGICDPLEQLGEFRNIQICPQDCTDEILFSPNTDGPNRKGIDQSSRGLCTCNQLGSCHCSKTTTNDLPPPFKDNQPKKNPRQELQKDDSGLKSTCDGSCLVVLLTVGTGVTLALVLTSAYFCKNSR
ncbi:hypothetical protein GE061_010699 [Apolygus lucorum]|uniref:RET cysteine rich domain-containing protein n=1 Tax=Apolygus lucorum TaxID=248454 RepID=A0A6A4KAL9_APOLU|nr:hypothetical protein GE061_010699 [Apolygus lucorum]